MWWIRPVRVLCLMHHAFLAVSSVVRKDLTIHEINKMRSFFHVVSFLDIADEQVRLFEVITAKLHLGVHLEHISQIQAIRCFLVALLG